MMRQISRDEFFKQAKELYGEDSLTWEFKCSHCGNVQSGNSIIKQMKEGIASQRHGLLKRGDPLNPQSECYSSTCNWVAYGLIRSGILLIHDPSKPHNIDSYENCASIFPFAKEAS